MPLKTHLKQGDFTISRTEPFQLECGGELNPASMRCAVYGEPNAESDNVVLVCHALSGSSRVDEWWPELFAPGAPFADGKWCVVCTNVLGSCYGTTGPLSLSAATGRPYGTEFPLVSVGDTVRAQRHVLDALGIPRLRAVIGASIGGMQAMEWAIRYPDQVDDCVAIGAAPLSALGLALNHVQRRTIETARDRREGMRLARGLATCTYKSTELFDERHGRKRNRVGDAPWESKEGRFDIAGYLDHQGDVFDERFEPDSYIAITRAMDLWDPERVCGEDAYARIQARVTLVGITTDWLFPAANVRALAQKIRHAGSDCAYREIESAHGHDAFLAEPEHVVTLLNEVLESGRTLNLGKNKRTRATSAGAQTGEPVDAGTYVE